MRDLLVESPYAGVIALIIAPFLGSFFALLADRLPRGQDLVFARSKCSACGHVLMPADLVPIASFLALSGRCRRCKAQIPYQTLLFELAALLLTAQVILTLGADWIAFVGLLLGLVLLAIAAIDLKYFYIPDILSFPLIFAGLLIAYLLPRIDLVSACLGAVTGYAVLAFISWGYRRLRGREGLGLGDAKLFAAAGAWVGWQGLPLVLLIGSGSGILVVLFMYVRHKRINSQDPIPFGPFLALGFWLVWLYIPVLH